ncbi:major facilitator superfamily domain-containing protein [Aspergillus pseudoustus]|uniref:Major facilitator superfamily domain-containing protein n=1 Tax=Aspergillus pseudoustus TaxID=1810923 RepID=A0ABR4JCQ7_9EURO
MAGLSQNGACRSCQHQDDISTRPAPWKVEFRSSNGFVTWVVAIAVFTDSFIWGMIIPILPEVLKTRIFIPTDELQKWMSILLAAFGGALLVGSPVSGYYADKSSSRQAPFLIGLLALGGSTVMFWFAQSAAALVIARTLQGLSAAVVWTVGMALIVDTVGKDQVGAATGIVSMAMTVGTVSGPFIGGLVLSKAGYHAVFSLAIALIALDITLRLFMIEKKNALEWIPDQSASSEETERLIAPPAQGSFSSGAGVKSGDTDAHASQPNGKPAEDDVTVAFSGKKKNSVPGILRLMCSGALLVVLAATVIQAVAYASFDSVLPLYVMSTFHMDPMGIGLCFVPLFTPSFFSTLIGSVVDRYGSREIALLGFLLDVPSFLLLQLVTENTTHDRIILYILLLLAGLAAALKTVALMVEVNNVVDEKEKECPGIFGEQGGTAQAYGLFNVAWSGGQVLGPLAAGWLVDWKGWATMVSVFGIVSGGMAVVLAITSKRLARPGGGR